MEEILHQLVPVGSLSPLFTAFYTSKRCFFFVGFLNQSTGWFPLLKPGSLDFKSCSTCIWTERYQKQNRRGSRGNWTQKDNPNCFALTKGPNGPFFLMRTQGGFFLRMKSKPRRAGTTFLCSLLSKIVNWKLDCFVNSLASSIALFYQGIRLRTTNCDWK